MRFAVAACAIAVVFLGGLVTWLNAAPGYSTGIGEQRSIAFVDGSTVNLNSRTKIRVRYSAHERAVDLLRGQALFSVAKDSARPFIVTTDSTQVRAVGTEFDVYRKESSTTVTVIEGRVAILRDEELGELAPPERQHNSEPGSALPETSAKTANTWAPRSIFVAAGEQITVTPRLAARPLPANVAQATAWTQRRLVFVSTPLAEVAQEFNRYAERPLRIGDPRLNRFEIDGVFSSTDPSSLIRFLRQRPDMKVTETDSDIVVTSR